MCRSISAVLILLVLLGGPVMAQQGDGQQKIYIESRELEIDEPNGISEYRGDVSFSRGGMHLTADKARLFEQAGKLQKLLAWGRPVHLRQRLEGDSGETRAVANRMEYLAEDDRLFLYGEAHLWQDGNEFSGDVIEYHLSEEKVIARSDQSRSGRVHIVIEPTGEPTGPADESGAGTNTDAAPRPDEDRP